MQKELVIQRDDVLIKFKTNKSAKILTEENEKGYIEIW